MFAGSPTPPRGSPLPAVQLPVSAGARAPRELPIESYAIIGDCRSAALVSSEGSIDWLCWPRFDSDPIFAHLLDSSQGGRFAIAPAVDFRSSRAYRPDSNILVTSFQTSHGDCRLTDLLAAVPMEYRRRQLLPESLLIRRLEGIRGNVPIDVVFEPRSDFGRRPVRLRHREGSGFTCSDARHVLHLASDFLPPAAADTSVRARLILQAGQTVTFALTYTSDAPAVFPPIHDIERVLDATDRYWRDWASRCPEDIPYRDAVVRSALVLKLLSFAPSGAVVASPSTSLPEVPAGDRNWDYRYCWLRDASLTVRAFRDLGFQDEADAFAHWILHATRLTRPRVRVLYDVFGRSPGPERKIEGLSGYRQARPVRAGNMAMEQVQLDVYGEVMDAVSAAYGGNSRLSRDERLFVEDIAQYVCDHWRDPDSGIWESRGEPAQYVESKVMCWLAAVRAADLADRGLIRLKAEPLRGIAAEIREAVFREGFSERLNSFRSTFDSDDVDAALLRLPLVGFCEATDPQMEGTIDAIRHRLGRGDLIYRSKEEAESGEGAFLICSFWLVDCLARQGRLPEAEDLFQRLLARANDVGLYSEEVDARSGGFLGNFPLAFSHVGLINAAVTIGRMRKT